MSVCKECGLDLVHQLIDKEGLPLSGEELSNYIEYIYSYDRTLECNSCGELCYHTKELRTPPETGNGLCNDCGGENSKKRPSHIKDIKALQVRRRACIWSCPVHGTVPVRDEIQNIL
jgi:hypothetical protein